MREPEELKPKWGDGRPVSQHQIWSISMKFSSTDDSLSYEKKAQEVQYAESYISLF